MIFKRLKIEHGNKYCNYYLNKDGTFNYRPISHISKFYCLMKKIFYYQSINETDFTGNDEDEIVSKLLVFKNCTQYPIKYFKYKGDVVLFRSDIKNIADILTITILLLAVYGNTNNVNFLYVAYRITMSKKITDNDIFIRIFFTEYANKERLKKLKLNISKIPNFHALYKLLKKKKIVDYYYDVSVPNMLANEKIIYKIYSESKQFKKLKPRIAKLFKPFNNKVILKFIDKYVDKSFDKKYIKNKFNELTKKYSM